MTSDPLTQHSHEQWLADCYGDMRRLARRLIASDAMQAQLSATDLANEAVLRLLGAQGVGGAERAHQLAIAARTMRRVLIDEARKARAAKRHVPAFVTTVPGMGALVDLEALDEALAALALYSREHADIVEMRFLLGLSVEETADASGIPARTVKRRWQAARLWLLDYLGNDAGPRA